MKNCSKDNVSFKSVSDVSNLYKMLTLTGGFLGDLCRPRTKTFSCIIRKQITEKYTASALIAKGEGIVE